MPSDSTSRTVGRAVRLPWLLLGLVCVALGAVGVVVPGLPTTIFFICAAASFGRSSERLERWVLELPGIGAAVKNYRAGLGMPRKAKVIAVCAILFFSWAALWVVHSLAGRGAIVTAASVGAAYVVWRVPTRERVVASNVNGPRQTR